MIDAVVDTVSCNPFNKSCIFVSLYMMPNIKAYIMATAPASVAVNAPILIPPIIIIGNNSGKIAGINTFINFIRVIFSFVITPYPLRFEIMPTNIIIVTHNNTPTPNPDMNNFPIETFAILPYKIIAIPGGIRGVIIDEVAVTTLENSKENPFLSFPEQAFLIP